MTRFKLWLGEKIYNIFLAHGLTIVRTSEYNKLNADCTSTRQSLENMTRLKNAHRGTVEMLRRHIERIQNVIDSGTCQDCGPKDTEAKR